MVKYILIFDKAAECPFLLLRYPHAQSNVPYHQPAGVFQGQLVRFRIVCNSVRAFKHATTQMTLHLLARGHKPTTLMKGWNAHLSKFCNDKSCIIDATNREVYQYNDKFNEFYMGWASGTQYGLLNNTLLFAPYTVPRTLTVFYYTFNSAQDVNGNDIQSLTTDTDTTIIPAVSDFAEKILVNGVCYEIKKRTDNTRIQYWLDQFKSGQNELRNYAQGEDQSCQFIVGHEAESFVKPVLKGSWS